jgi:Reverse transcriptase (RNA-dependent DNA polymerase)
MSARQSSLDEWAIPTGRSLQGAETRLREPNYIHPLNLNEQQNQYQNNNHNQVSQEEQQNDDGANNDNRNISHNATLVQTSIATQHRSSALNHQHWGDSLRPKSSHSLRIAFRNINSFPMSAANSRNLELTKDINDGGFDILGLGETNIAWNRLPEADSLKERFRGTFEAANYNASHNSAIDWTAKRQSGGTLTVTNSPTCYRIIKTGNDPKRYGRWNWILLRGSHDIKVRIITCYRPVKAQGATSAYQQQVRAINESGSASCPRQQLLDDLHVQITTWIEEGNKIVFMGDLNEDVRTNSIRLFFQRLGMREIILERHGTDAPNTFQDGSLPIDAIFATNTINTTLCGYTEIGWGSKSDHRLIWADLDLTNLLGTDPPLLWHPQARRLKADDPRIVKSFNKLRTDHMVLNGFKEKMKVINDLLISIGINHHSATLLEELDKIRVEGILEADRHCCKLKMGRIPWSPELRKCIHRIRYFRACCAKYGRKPRRISPRVMIKLLLRTGDKHKVTTFDEALTLLKAEFLAYNEFKKVAVLMRQSFLEELAQAQAEQSGVKQASIVKQLKLREQQRELGRKVKYILGKKRVGLTAVEAPDRSGQWVLVNDKEAVELGCIKENISRFTQANNTPALLRDQVELLGWTGNGQGANDLLSGIANPALHPAITPLAEYLSTPPEITILGDINTSLSTEDFRREWRRCKEFTSSGPSQLHFGHFKASCYNNDTTEADRWFAEVSLKFGYSLLRWQHGIDVMIPKKEDSLRVDMLRTIVLLEADFNFINKIVGKRAMINAEKAGTVAEEQFGSRKRKSSILHATNKAITTDVLRQTKQDNALLVLDAKACYDRIAPPIAAISLRRQGVPAVVTHLMFHTIDQMSHTIRTSYGDSTQCYKSCTEKFHGILQGNGAGPIIWAMVSTPILNKLRQQGYGATLTYPFSRKTKQIAAFAFVDDTDLIQDISQATEDFSAEPQGAVNEWEANLHVTGGALVPSKCCWFGTSHKWQNDTWSIASITERPGEVFIRTANGTRTPIQRYEPSESVSSLGLKYSPSGNMTDELEYLKSKSEQWAEHVRSGGVSRREAWYLLNAVIMKTIEYPLLATTFSKKELDQVMQPILKIGLPKSGICRNMARDAVFSPCKYMGFGIHHPYITQGIRKVMLFMSKEHRTSSDLIRIAWENTVLESGLGPNFLTETGIAIRRVITKTWTTSLWEFIDTHNIKLQHVPAINESRSQNDFYIMKPASAFLSTADLRHFNHCRMYLQVNLLSDVLTADGRRVRQEMMNGNIQSNLMAGLHQWPLQPRPSERIWRLWRSSLQRIISMGDNGTLTIPQTIHWTKNWVWFLSHSENRLFENRGDRFMVHSISMTPNRRTTRGCKRFALLGRSLEGTTPPDISAVSVFRKGNEICISGDSGSIGIFAEAQDTSKEWASHLERSLFGQEEPILQGFLQGKLVIVSDGSVKDGIGAAAWIITTEEHRNLHYVVGKARVPSNPSTIDSHRAETGGLLGGLLHFHALLRQWQVTEGEVTFACDNYNAIKTAFDLGDVPFIGITIADYDLMTSIRCLLLPGITYNWKHVKGHQDDVSQDLDPLAEMNVRMDSEAKEMRVSVDSSLLNWYPSLPEEDWALAVRGHKVTKNLEGSMRDAISASTMKKYWSRKAKLPAEQFQNVGWQAIGTAMKEVPISRRHWISKHASGVCGVNAIRHLWKEIDSPNCPRCGLPETARHVWICQHRDAQLIWELAIRNLKSALTDIQTSPDIIEQIGLGLEKWYTGEDLTTLQDKQLIIDQCSIGWHFFIEGFIGIHWGAQQELYYKSIGSRKSGLRWTVALLKKLWNIAWDLWSHRNGLEHHNDAVKEMQLLQDEVDVCIEFHIVSTDDDLECMFSEEEVTKVRSGTPVYIKAWLANIRAFTTRLERRHHNTREFVGMRNVMMRFLNGIAP